MIRFSFVIGSAIFLAGALSLPAQHPGGGHSSSGGHGMSASGGFHSHGSALSSTPSTLNTRSPLPGQLIYPEPIGLQPQYSGYTGINYGALPSGNRGTNHGRYGYGYGYPYFPFYLSTFDDSPSGYSGYYNNSAPDAAIDTSNVTANMLGEQVARLSAEVDSLRDQREAAYQGQPPVPYRAPPAEQDQTISSNPVTVVLQNGKKLEMQNYAVMGNEIWDFSSMPTKKIPLSTVDLAASRAATEANGAEFPNL